MTTVRQSITYDDRSVKIAPQGHIYDSGCMGTTWVMLEKW